MNTRRRTIHIIMGFVLFAFFSVILADALTPSGAKAIGTMVWMMYWWITRPFHIAITGLVPVLVNAFFSISSMDILASQYISDSIILIFGSGLLTIPWAKCGLDKRISLRVLSIIGPSMTSQITVWLLASIFLSAVLPNVMVCAVFSPIAVSMLKAVGHHNIDESESAVPILLAIGWGVSLGGARSPLGGAMNLVAISYLEDFTGKEFMYVDWFKTMVPYMIFASLVLLIFMLVMSRGSKPLDGSRKFFIESYKELGKMNRDEKICATLFILAMVAAFARPLYAELLPSFTPAYMFLVFGSINFFITSMDKSLFLDWEDAEKHTLWGLMISFAGGMALGKLINESGATDALVGFIINMNLDGGLTTVILFVTITRMIAEVTNGTTAAAIMVPIMFAFTGKMGLDPRPFWFIGIMAFNYEYLLPISVRAIPVSHGLSPVHLLKKGWMIAVISTIFVIIYGYVSMTLFPNFGMI